MIDTPSGDNWLDARTFACPHCRTPLYAVIRSPMYDEWQLYCDRCPKRVEISYAHPVARAIGSALDAQPLAPGHRFVAHMRAMEARLKPCPCGGGYRHDAPRRCHACHGIVLVNAPDTDLWPEVYGLDMDERDPTEEEIAAAAHFEATHVRRDDLWR